MKYVWCPQYCFCTHEGGMEDIAICRTRAIARRVLTKHKKENSFLIHGEKPDWMVWRIVKREVIEQ
jgi:hypothetical protein